MDRLARSLVDLESIVDELVQRGVVVSFVQERMTFSADVSDSFATFQRQLIGAVAELERSLIRERQREGIELTKARRAYRGRTRRLTDEQIEAALVQVAAGVPKAEVTRRLTCSRRTLYDALQGRGGYAAAPSSDHS